MTSDRNVSNMTIHVQHLEGWGEAFYCLSFNVFTYTVVCVCVCVCERVRGLTFCNQTHQISLRFELPSNNLHCVFFRVLLYPCAALARRFHLRMKIKSPAAETGGVFTGDRKSPLDSRPLSVTLKPPPNEAILQMKGERTPQPTVASVRI